MAHEKSGRTAYKGTATKNKSQFACGKGRSGWVGRTLERGCRRGREEARRLEVEGAARGGVEGEREGADYGIGSSAARDKERAMEMGREARGAGWAAAATRQSAMGVGENGIELTDRWETASSWSSWSWSWSPPSSSCTREKA